jgi:uncharacterized protein YkwD
MKKTTLTATLATAILLTACGGGDGDSSDQTSVMENSHPFEAPFISEELKNQYLSAINSVRATARYCGNTQYPAVAPLKWEDGLYRSAYEHSLDISISGHFSHTGSGTSSDWTSNVLSLGRGSIPDERINNNMGRTFYAGYGENVTIANSLGTSIAQFLSSPPHCSGMMAADMEYIGIANVGGVWTQNFLRKTRW